jgi:hypothetical protein
MGLKIKWRKTGVKQILGVQIYYHTTARLQVANGEQNCQARTTADRLPNRTRTQEYGHSVSLRLGEGLVIIVTEPATKVQRDAHGLCL